MRDSEMSAPGAVGAATGRDGGTAEETTPILGADDAARKRRATLIAKAALAGITVTPQTDGSYLIRRWSLSREVADLDELDRALRLQGVKP